MLLIDFILHKDADEALLQAIAGLKAIRWSYPIAQQIDWIAANIEPEDWHLLLKNDDELVAYMNLVKIRPVIDGYPSDALGIGNVCTKESGKGYGNQLMEAVNRFLDERALCGMLFCKDHLVPYYQKFNWILIKQEHCNQEISQVNTLLYNIGSEKSTLSYNGRMF
ncbi:MAG: hypothetical protein EOP54_16050 [Sphingobacteriales bacterium]|nr:MAG: hypothetical protein EOP54_16050 [Sphingobacteriales bacterium]